MRQRLTEDLADVESVAGTFVDSAAPSLLGPMAVIPMTQTWSPVPTAPA